MVDFVDVTMNRDKFILYLTQQIGFTREAIRDQSTCPNLRVRIGLEAKLELLTDLLENVRIGGFSDGDGLACTVSGSPTANDCHCVGLSHRDDCPHWVLPL